MNNRSWFGSGLGAMAPAGVRDRVQWGGYGFAAGLLLGLILGVFFYGIVSFLLRYGLVVLLLVPLVWLIFVVRNWRNRREDDAPEMRTEVVTRGRDGSLIDTTYVIEGQTKPVPERRER